MDNNNNNNLRRDWRSQLPPDSRKRIINRIRETLNKYIPSSGPNEIIKLTNIATKFEAKIFNGAINQSDYLHKISMKLLTMENNAKNAAASSSSTPAANNATPMDTIPTNQGQLLPGGSNQSQAPRPLMSQTMQSNTASGMTGSTVLPSSVSSITNSNVTSAVNMQNVAGMLQDSSGQHGLSSNMFSGFQKPHAISSQQPQTHQPGNHSYLRNTSGLQQPQQQLLNSQAGSSSLQTNQHPVHMLSQPPAGLQQTHQPGHGLFSSQGQQQSQNQPSQQQMTPQLQSRHQQLGSQPQPNLIQQDVQQRLQVSGQVTGSLLPPQNVVNQQRPVYQPQRTHPEMSSSSLDSKAQMENANGGDWQEEVYQKIKSMNEAYLPDLKKIYDRVVSTLQQESLLQQQRSEQFEKLKQIRRILERMIQLLTVSKSNIMPLLKDKMAYYEKQIIDFLNTHRRRTIQQGQLPQSQMQQPMQQPQSQTVQDQSHDSQTNPQMQSVSMQVSGPRSQQSSLENMLNNVRSSHPRVSAPQQNIPSSLPASSLESGQGNALKYVKQVAVGSMQQNASQQVNNSFVSAQSSSLLQHQHLKQQQRQTQQQHSPQGQRATYPLQQLKQGSQLSVSSPKHLQGASPKMTQQHMFPKVDKKNLPSVNKKRTPLQSANSPVVVPSPATPSAPSPMQIDSEKPSSLSMGNIARQQATGMQGVVPASPQEFTSPDENNLNPLTSSSGKPSATELPIERLIRAVKSISPQALSSAVSDIGSVVSLVDRIAGSASGNGSRASVGEDLVAMTKCRLLARDFMTQEGMMARKKMKRHITAMPFSVASFGGSVGDN